jgi:hypothetical protein
MEISGYLDLSGMETHFFEVQGQSDGWNLRLCFIKPFLQV